MSQKNSSNEPNIVDFKDRFNEYREGLHQTCGHQGEFGVESQKKVSPDYLSAGYRILYSAVFVVLGFIPTFLALDAMGIPRLWAAILPIPIFGILLGMLKGALSEIKYTLVCPNCEEEFTKTETELSDETEEKTKQEVDFGSPSFQRKLVGCFAVAFFGALGVHHFILGNTKAGITYLVGLLFFPIALFSGIAEGILLLLMDDQTFEKNYYEKSPEKWGFVYFNRN